MRSTTYCRAHARDTVCCRALSPTCWHQPSARASRLWSARRPLTAQWRRWRSLRLAHCFRPFALRLASLTLPLQVLLLRRVPCQYLSPTSLRPLRCFLKAGQKERFGGAQSACVACNACFLARTTHASDVQRNRPWQRPGALGGLRSLRCGLQGTEEPCNSHTPLLPSHSPIRRICRVQKSRGAWRSLANVWPPSSTCPRSWPAANWASV